MGIQQKIAVLLKNAMYNNPRDERLFVYRNEEYKWIGVTINFGHPKACRFWALNAGLLLSFILLLGVFATDAFRCVVFTAVFLSVISWEVIHAFWVAEFGRKNEGSGNHGTRYTMSCAFLIVNLIFIAMPLLFAIIFHMQGQKYWIFLACLTVLTFVRMGMLVFRILKQQRS